MPSASEARAGEAGPCRAEGTAPPPPWPSFLGDACGGGGGWVPWTGWQLWSGWLPAARGHSQTVPPLRSSAWPPGRATGLSPGGWSPVTPTSLHPDASAGMTRVDLRNYLERVYNVPVAAVRTRVQHGSNRRRDHRNVRIKQPDYKVAYVQLAHGQTFTFPDLFPKGKRPGGSSADEDLRDQVLEEQQQRQSPDPRRGGVPSWFGL
ncbi:large ribosomal subunit protein uL23m isoform X1 [Bos javanicus]|uniref:large ribosomal subunit protein uL23m isoform X1 n=1 Tax=Bos javanicus TaxID=9906 RepID=UPI002AA7A760|nr:large ribosomal subunit protein uL23m isoform X1 [Bos javanicus]